MPSSPAATMRSQRLRRLLPASITSFKTSPTTASCIGIEIMCACISP
jgi:hypothetical protein